MVSNIQTDVRASMMQVGKTLPLPFYNFIQRVLTWITGKAVSGQKPIMGGLSPWSHLFGALLVLITSALISIILWLLGGIFVIFLPITVGLTLSASRTLWLTDLHSAAHGSFSRKKWENKVVGDVVSLLLMVLPHSDYRRSHCVDHHSHLTFCSPDKDPDGSFLCWMGLTPGASKIDLWRRLLTGLISPRTHLVFFASRIKANFINAGRLRSLISLLYVLVLVYLAVKIGWMTLLIAWILPVGLLYQISAIAGWAGEHAWFAPKTGNHKDWHKNRTHARFFGVPFNQSGTIQEQSMWICKMLGQMALRFLIVPGDLPNHDWHHHHPASRDWTSAAYARQTSIEAGETYSIETWGIVAAIDYGLSSIAAQSPLEQDRVSALDAMDVFGAM